jgi:hypothetical protein
MEKFLKNKVTHIYRSAPNDVQKKQCQNPGIEDKIIPAGVTFLVLS